MECRKVLPWGLAAIALIVLKLWLVWSQPVIAHPLAVHDDRLFLDQALHIAQGEWLGPYHNRILAKGAGYPLFIAGSALLHIPLPIAQHLLYVAAAACMAWAMRPWFRNGAWAFVVFIVLLWNPMSYDAHMCRVLRQAIYTPIVMFCFAGFAGLMTRLEAGWRAQAGWAVLLGISAGWLWITREESIWIVPSGVMCFIAALLIGLRHRRVWASVWPWGIALVIAVLPSATVRMLNGSYYGWYGTVEFKAPEFIAAYAAISRVKSDEFIPMVPVPRSTRLSIAKVSPSFAKLEPFLEGDLGRNWAGCSEDTTHLPRERRELGGGWWMWALRDAVVAANRISNPQKAMKVYARIAREVNAACDEGLLAAGPKRHSMAPVLNQYYFEKGRGELYPFLRTFLTLKHFQAYPPASSGEAKDLAIYDSLVRWRYAPFCDPSGSSAVAEKSLRLKILQKIGESLCLVQTGIVFSGLIALTLAIATPLARRRWPGGVTWFACAAWGGTAALLLMNFIIDLTSFSTCNPLYLSHAYVVGLIAAFASLCSLVYEFRGSTNREEWSVTSMQNQSSPKD